jgi:hypothetical protein
MRKPERPMVNGRFDPEVFRFSERITSFPVVHGSGDYAQEVREVLLGRHFDCLAVPLPPSFARGRAQRRAAPQVHGRADRRRGKARATFRQALPAGDRRHQSPCRSVRRAYADLSTGLRSSGFAPDPRSGHRSQAPRRPAAVLAPRPARNAGRVRRMAFELHRLDSSTIDSLRAGDQDWPWIATPP